MNDDSFTDPREDWSPCSLPELCRRGSLEEYFVVQCVEHGVADVSGPVTEWVFSAPAVLRIHKAWRLHRDLDIQIGSLALILELLEERDQLRQQVAALLQRLQQWEEGS